MVAIRTLVGCKYRHALRANVFGRACFFPYGAWSGPVRTTSALSRLQKMLLGANRVYLINFYRSNIFYRYCYIHVDLIPNNPPYTACRVASLHWPGPQPFTSSALQVSCPNGETCTNSTSPCPNRDTFTNSTDCATPWTSQLFICK